MTRQNERELAAGFHFPRTVLEVVFGWISKSLNLIVLPNYFLVQGVGSRGLSSGRCQVFLVSSPLGPLHDRSSIDVHFQTGFFYNRLEIPV